MTQPARTYALGLLLAALTLAACAGIPELEVSEAEFDDTTPYPGFVPFDILLKDPVPTITGDVETELTTRNADLTARTAAPALAAASGTPLPQTDPLLDRLDALRAKRNAIGQTTVIDDALRARIDAGITAPTVPE
jgi:hypothetical protein